MIRPQPMSNHVLSTSGAGLSSGPDQVVLEHRTLRNARLWPSGDARKAPTFRFAGCMDHHAAASRR